MATVDALNAQFGRGAVAFSSVKGEGSWGLRSEQRSPRYTTKWQELLEVA
jgi:DNA polymerase V